MNTFTFSYRGYAFNSFEPIKRGRHVIDPQGGWECRLMCDEGPIAGVIVCGQGKHIREAFENCIKESQRDVYLTMGSKP